MIFVLKFNKKTFSGYKEEHDDDHKDSSHSKQKELQLYNIDKSSIMYLNLIIRIIVFFIIQFSDTILCIFQMEWLQF